MQQLYPAWVQPSGWVTMMPTPGPLGRLVAKRRMELKLTQPELATLTKQYGTEVSQNNISRLESGKTQRINDPERLKSLGKALGFESDVDFILAAYAPAETHERGSRMDPEIEVLPPGPEGEIIALVRPRPDHEKRRALEVLRILFADQDVQNR